MKPERDPVRCAVDECDEEADVSTPVGAMCRSHSRELAEEMDR
jgi:hypothetical protein